MFVMAMATPVAAILVASGSAAADVPDIEIPHVYGKKVIVPLPYIEGDPPGEVKCPSFGTSLWEDDVELYLESPVCFHSP